MDFDCKINLDNSWHTYFAGETVAGTLKFTFDEPQAFASIMIKFIGEGRSKWCEYTREVNWSDDPLKGAPRYFNGHEIYFENFRYLLGDGNSQGINMLSGTVSYPISYKLPSKLPSSFEGKYGHVRYTIQVITTRPLKSQPHHRHGEHHHKHECDQFEERVMAFSVICPLDLNVQKSVAATKKLVLHEKVFHLLGKSGTVTVIASIPVTGYVSGQIIPITIECDNDSHVAIKRICLKMQKFTRYLADQPRNFETFEIKDIAENTIDDPVPAHQHMLCLKQFYIPALPPSANCSVLEYQYKLIVHAEIPGLHYDLQGSIDLLIGTVPLTTFKSPQPDPDVQETIKLMQESENVPNEKDKKTSAKKPLIFAEGPYKSNLIKTTKHHLNRFKVIGDVEFAPRYPLFVHAD